jgi:hypothetical protein
MMAPPAPFERGGPSPNPKGRPRLSQRERLKRLLDKLLSETVIVRDHHGQRRRMKRDALLQQLARAAVQGQAAARKLLVKVQKRAGMLSEDRHDEQQHGVLVVEPYLSPDEWEKKWDDYHVPLDPLDGLPGIDKEALAKAMLEKQRLQERGYEDGEDHTPADQLEASRQPELKRPRGRTADDT